MVASTIIESIAFVTTIIATIAKDSGSDYFDSPMLLTETVKYHLRVHKLLFRHNSGYYARDNYL